MERVAVGAIPAHIIVDGLEGEAERRRWLGQARARSESHEIRHVGGLAPPIAHLEQQADHVAHLLVERALEVHVCSRVAVALIMDGDGAHPAYGGERGETHPCRALSHPCRALVRKAGEVMLPHKVVRGGLHPVQAERTSALLVPVQALRRVHAADGVTAVEAVRVQLARRPVHRVPAASLGVALLSPLELDEAHVLRQHAVDGGLEGLWVIGEAVAVHVEVNRLPSRVNTGVRSARCDHSHVLLRPLGERHLQLVGDRRCILLKLQASVGQPVVHEPRTETHPGWQPAAAAAAAVAATGSARCARASAESEHAWNKWGGGRRHHRPTSDLRRHKRTGANRCALHGLSPTAASGREAGKIGFHRRSIAQRRSSLVLRGRLLELRYQAKPHRPSTITLPAQHHSPHQDGSLVIRRRPHNVRRQRLEPLVVPPLRLGHLGALLQPQLVEGMCRGPCPALRAHRKACLGLEVPLCGLHFVPRFGEHCTEVEVRRGLDGLKGDGLAEDLCCSARVLLRGVTRALSQQLRVRVARLRGGAGLRLRGLASPLLHRATILIPLLLLPQLLVKHPVQLPSGRVRRAVHAAQVRRRQLLIAAHVTDGVLLTLVIHV
eukprot:scaffold13542_cov58-Phaeocystis_antarctica.AAC.4